MSSTPNINLTLSPSPGTGGTFTDWRTIMNGESGDSNMSKIDAAIGDIKADITDIKNNAASGIPFGECTSANAETAKTVTIPGFELKDGAMAVVRFKNGHKAGTDFTLNINGTGAKTVLVNGMDGFSNYPMSISYDVIMLLTYIASSNAYICVTPTLADFASNADYANTADHAAKLSVSDIGSETQPIYFKNGEPVSCDMYNYQKNPLQRIGTWIDGTPIWRVALNVTLTKEEITRGYHELTSDDMGVRIPDEIPVITNTYLRTYRPSAKVTIYDSQRVEIDDEAHVMLNGNSTEYTLLAGIIEFAANKSDIIKQEV